MPLHPQRPSPPVEFVMAASRSLPSLAIKTSSRHGLYNAADAQLGIKSGEAVGSILNSAGDRPLHLLMAGFEALDLVNIGVVVADAAGRVLLANQTAEQVLDARDGVSISPRGTLRASGSGEAALNALLRQFGSPGLRAGEASGAVLAVQRSSGK